MLSFAEVVQLEHATLLTDLDQPLPPARIRSVSTTPADPDEVGHIRVHRWVQGTGDGFEALGLVFNVADPLTMLDEYMVQARGDYEAIYSQGANEPQMLEAAIAGIIAGGQMTDDVAQFMVDCTGIAMVLCRDLGGTAYEVTLLMPRITRERLLTMRCLIVTGGIWSVGDWFIDQDPGDVPVPLFALPIAHPWWQAHLWPLNGGPRSPVSGFQQWGMYASHNVTRRLRTQQ